MVRLYAVVLVVAFASFPARAECLLKPDLTQHGGHWRYHIEKNTHRQCWYLSQSSTNTSQAPSAVLPPARAQVMNSATTREAPRDISTPPFQQRDADAPVPSTPVATSFLIDDPWNLGGMRHTTLGDAAPSARQHTPSPSEAAPESSSPAAPSPANAKALAPTTDQQPAQSTQARAESETPLAAEQSKADATTPAAAETTVELPAESPSLPQSGQTKSAPRNFARWFATVAGASLAAGIAVLWCLQPMRERKSRPRAAAGQAEGQAATAGDGRIESGAEESIEPSLLIDWPAEPEMADELIAAPLEETLAPRRRAATASPSAEADETGGLADEARLGELLRVFEANLMSLGKSSYETIPRLSDMSHVKKARLG